jgi:hypothetical protein
MCDHLIFYKWPETASGAISLDDYLDAEDGDTRGLSMFLKSMDSTDTIPSTPPLTYDPALYSNTWPLVS